MSFGRPSEYSQEKADQICEYIVERKSLRVISEQSDMPSVSTICRWLAQQEDFRKQYARAKEAQVEDLLSEIPDIADTARVGEKIKDSEKDGRTVEYGDMIERSKLMIDARKWLASKLLPKKYGDRLELAGDSDNPININLHAKQSLEDRIIGVASRGRTESSISTT